MQSLTTGRLAASLRTAKKDQALNGADIAERAGRLAGKSFTETWVSRRLTGRKRLVTVDPDLFVLAQALNVGRDELIAMVTDAIFGTPPDEEDPR